MKDDQAQQPASDPLQQATEAALRRMREAFARQLEVATTILSHPPAPPAQDGPLDLLGAVARLQGLDATVAKEVKEISPATGEAGTPAQADQPGPPEIALDAVVERQEMIQRALLDSQRAVTRAIQEMSDSPLSPLREPSVESLGE